MVNIFISYSNEDEESKENILRFLTPFFKNNSVKPWHYKDIQAGEKFKKEIANALYNAELYLLLVSANFLASDYCYEIEMKKALKRHKEGRAEVIPIILDYCDWKSTPLADYSAKPQDGKPISSFTNKSIVFNEIVDAVKEVYNSRYKDDEIIVCSSGLMDYETISEAIENAPIGCTISILPGRYEESIHLNKPLKLIGDDRNSGRPIEIISRNSPCLTIDTDNCVVKNLTLECLSNQNNVCINVLSGVSQIYGCEIISHPSIGISLDFSSRCEICNSKIAVANGIGVHSNTEYSFTIENCEFSECHTGIYVEGNGTGQEILNNIFTRGKRGIRLGNVHPIVIQANEINVTDVGITINQNNPLSSREKAIEQENQIQAKQKIGVIVI